MQAVYEATQRRQQRLQALGFQVIVMWECQWQKRKDNDPELYLLVDGFDLKAPLNPRDAFFGGRTNAICLYAPPRLDRQIGYYDYTSLYPWVNKTKTYPLGHPTILYNPTDQNIRSYFGLALCTVLPPSELFHPVLPYRCGGKLTFPLCRSCVNDEIDRPLLRKEWVCKHSRDQRLLTGTWCTPELIKAQDMGYVIVTIHEVWHFDRQCEGLFKDYVNTWLKLKEEASGYPSNCVTPEQRQQHVRDYEVNEGIQLDMANIRKNPGKRAVAKLMLNSMWGKFGQRLDKTQVIEFTRAQEMHTFLACGKYDVRYVSPLTEDRVEVHYKIRDPMIDVSPNLNIFVACFTTCHARLRLYQDLQQLGERVLYFDTDSIVFVKEPGNNPSLGKYLGQFKDELSADEHILEFCSGGPKNYGYVTSRGTIVCKVRGFSLNVEGSLQLNYHILKENVMAEVERPRNDQTARTTRIHESTKIVRHPKTYTLTTQPRHKDYRLVFNKRVLPTHDATMDPYKSYPYGYHQVGDLIFYEPLINLMEQSSL